MTKSMDHEFYCPLLDAGFHAVKLHELHLLAATNTHRKALFQRLLLFWLDLNRHPLKGQLWIGGSFMTTKAEPGDIDLAVILDANSVQRMPIAQQKDLGAILSPEFAEKEYGIDLYCARSCDLDSVAYYSGLLGFCRDRTTPAGIATLNLLAGCYERTRMAEGPAQENRQSNCSP